MNWIVIDREKCDTCGICTTRCLRVFSVDEDNISADANEETCNLCGHCVALCPAGAISHSLLDMENFIPVEDDISYDTDRFFTLVRSRRSHRSYKKKAIPRQDMEKLIEMCRYCPTGSNLQTVEIKVITDPAKITELSDLTIAFFMGMITDVEKQTADFHSRGEEPPKELAVMNDFARRYKMLGQARDLGIDPILHKAPAVMVFHSAPSPSTPKDDCVIAAHTVVLGAMTMGLGTCYIGLLNFSANSSPAVKQALGLPGENKVYSVIVLGYPRLKFLKTVDRKPIKAAWE
ncbi:MAG: nitroreductase family protein [Desulfobacterales bacterium]